MAGVQWATSLDHYTTVTHRFNSTSLSAATLTIGGFGRNGTNGMRAASGGGSGTAISTAAATLPAALSTIYFAAAFRASALPTSTAYAVMQIWDVGVKQCELRLLADGTFQVTRDGTVIATSTGFAALPNVFYHLEWKTVISNTGSTILKINEVEHINQSSIDTQNTANSTVSQIVLGLEVVAGALPAVNLDFDDVVVRDDAFNGDQQVRCFLPTGTGTTDQWTATGAASTRQAVDESAPNDDTDYMETATVNDLSLFTFDSIPSTSTITAVVPMPYAKKTDAGTAKIKSVVRSGGTNYPGAEKAPSNGSYEYHPDVLMVNPDTSAAFTPTEWNAPIEIGVERSA